MVKTKWHWEPRANDEGFYLADDDKHSIAWIISFANKGLNRAKLAAAADMYKALEEIRDRASIEGNRQEIRRLADEAIFLVTEGL